jgi:phenylalanyl-tRNA synthetase beta chain
VKVPLSALRAWVDLPWDAATLAHRLTMAGLEVESIEPAAPDFSGVLTARILAVEPHPQAAKLRVCRVAHGAGAGVAPLSIVCGAANARAGLVSALATVGARLPGEVRIEPVRLRGVESSGMLCSARELGLGEGGEGILELPEATPVGADLRRVLDLDDPVLDIAVTANRGDALSVLGVAREAAALSGSALRWPVFAAPGEPAARPEATAAVAALPVRLSAQGGAGRLLAGVIRGLDNARASPLWLRERLRRSGQRSISPVVDATNFLMLELGQPMHAYDRSLLSGHLCARWARSGELLRLLDGREIALEPDVLVIADDHSVLGLAGIMGGERTAIAASTRDIALEVAWFPPEAIAGRARRYGLTTDASQRFERGVDPQLQLRALERAVALIRELCGGEAAGESSAEASSLLPRSRSVTLRAGQYARLIGAAVAPAQVEQRLRALGMEVTPVAAAPGAESWRVVPPSWRFDIALEADLIEEVARIGGVDGIPEQDAALAARPRPLPDVTVDERVILRTLAARGFQEAITLAFVDPKLQRALFGEAPVVRLRNPMSSELSELRRSLWPGLLHAARENLRRQQPRVRLFEIAQRFAPDDARGGERRTLAAIAVGARLPEQWGTDAVGADYFDLKGDLAAVLALGGAAAAGGAAAFEYEPGRLECLHPGRSARILCQGTEIGHIGELHPRLVRELDLIHAAILFEVDYDGAFAARLPRFRETSRYPLIRRDISFTVPESVAFRRVRERVTVVTASLLQELRVFDVYQGREVELGRKSIALGLILQDLYRTLTDEEADRVVAAVRADLQSSLDARIRE